ncbi:nucleoside/nucleotide kinase family protein [Psychroserpens ponticola]|uniref:Shikimate kinase n=1 Tax=Psychroserpens ponticola TaxID=2932268 RepID=A0ABY7RTW9_9FLAO|nr:hypothetical protein [Psychroserpens ponticola]WCO00569.1 hypothetical protein MUN68_010865 [Psychroserpens ponticola]
MSYNIVLIGAMGVGKTTISKVICDDNEAYSIFDSDIEKQVLINQTKIDSNQYETLLTNNSWTKANDYARSFLNPDHLRTILEKAGTNHIINIGGDLIDWNNSKDFESCQKILEEYPNVILLSYSNDIMESYNELSERIMNRPNHDSNEVLQEQADYNFRFIKSKLFNKVARHIIEIKGKSKIDIANEIIAILIDSMPKTDEV